LIAFGGRSMEPRHVFEAAAAAVEIEQQVG
jgi:hypothetical protein